MQVQVLSSAPFDFLFATANGALMAGHIDSAKAGFFDGASWI